MGDAHRSAWGKQVLLSPDRFVLCCMSQLLHSIRNRLLSIPQSTYYRPFISLISLSLPWLQFPMIHVPVLAIVWYAGNKNYEKHTGAVTASVPRYLLKK
jgi:hypothetical protein